MQSSRLSADARRNLPGPATCQDQSTRQCCQYRAYKVEGPNHGDAVDVVVLDEEEAVRGQTHRRAGLSDDARGATGEHGSAMARVAAAP